MAQYRRIMNKDAQKHYHVKYKKHMEREGGIFTPDKRRKLLGLKSGGRKISEENIANFWYDVRNSIKHGLADLCLVADVSHQNQMKEMFGIVPFEERRNDQSKIDISQLMRSILFSQPRSRIIKKKGQFVPVENKDDDVWLAHLAYDVVIECFRFFQEHNLVTSKAHARLIDETEDMLNSEIGRAWFVPRGRRNIKF